jgi:DNA-binding Lrp family transcriptional regulator
MKKVELASKQDKLERNFQENLKILFTLMALSGKSDRAIAKILGISNTSLSRRRKNLEQKGYIKAYTIEPNLSKLGLGVVVFSFASTTDNLTQAQIEEVHKLIPKYPELLCLLEGQHLEGTNWFAATVHKDYNGFVEFSKKVKQEVTYYPPQPRIERHTIMFYTDKLYPKPFSFKNIESLFPFASSLNHKAIRQ